MTKGTIIHKGLVRVVLNIDWTPVYVLSGPSTPHEAV
jgi:hypothetical protein